MTNNETPIVTRRKLQDLYRSIHIGRQEKDLEKLKQKAREYLSNVKFKKKFVIIPFDVYLKEVIIKTNSKKAEGFLEIEKGFSNLEQYGIKLLQSPWRKEFQSIKLYSSFFKHEIEPSVPVVFATSILQLYGYKSEGCQDLFKLDEPISLDRVLTIAFELFLVTIELQVLLEIAKEIELYTSSATLDDILEARVNTVGDVEEAKNLLFKLKSISTERKRIQSDEVDLQSERKKSKSSTIENLKDEDIPNVRSRSFPNENPERQNSYPSHLITNNTSRGGQGISTKVTYIPSSNGVDTLTDRDLYGGIEGLNDSDLYGVNVSPTFTHHYPQVMHENQSDYVSMSGMNEDECYEMMSPQIKLPNGHYDFPPPTYDEAVHIPYTGYLTKDWVVIPNQSKPSDHDIGTGMSGLNIRENGAHYNEKQEMVQNDITLGSKVQTHRKKEKGNANQIQIDDHVLSARSSRVKAPSTVTTTGSYKLSSSHNEKRTRQEIASVKGTNGNEKLQTQTRETTECNLKSIKNELPSQSSKETAYNKTDHSSSYKTKHESRPSKVMLPPTTTTQVHPQTSLHVLDDKSKAAFKEEQEYLTRKESRLTYCAFCKKEATRVCIVCSKVCCKHCESFFSTLPCEGATVHCLREKNSKDNNLQEYEQNENCAYCGKDSTQECHLCKIKSCDVCKHVKGKTDKCNTTIGHLFRPFVSKLKHDTEVKKDFTESNICDFCGLVAHFICADCHILICKQCQHIYDKDHCSVTKKDHFFRVITSQTKIETKEVSWPCVRCTFSNPPQNKICAMCATSRGVTSTEFPESGSRKCAHCTYGNSEDARICVMCSRSLSHGQVESYI